MTINNEFEKLVNKYPNNIALVSEAEGQLSYDELNRCANYIANRILQNKSDNSQVIGICINRSFSMIAAMLGVLKAGRAYLPLDIYYPRERLALMMNNSDIKTIICTEETSSIVAEGITKIVLSKELCFEADVCQCGSTSSLACILYTSGSTGVPNGVMISHKAIMNTLKWAIRYYELDESDVSLQVPSCSFTSSLQDIFTTLLSGGALVILKEKDLLNMKYLKMLSDKYKVTHFDMVPSLYKEYIKTIKNNSTLRFVLLAGEPLSFKLVQEHFELLPKVRLINEYGMAETSSCFSYYEIYPSSERVYIGTVIDNMDYIIDEIDSEGIGELLIKGIGLSDGYHNNLKYTEEKFINIDGTRYLKTGDYVKESQEGYLIYIGRRDNQIKVNGKRINLNEIDYVLQKNPKVVDCVTTGISFMNKQLIVSFIKSEETHKEYFLEELKRILPSHYIPNYIELLEDFHYLPNKKINLKRMKELFAAELEQQIMKSDDKYNCIMKTIKDVSKGLIGDLDIDKDIREQGIDSIMFIRITAELEEALGFEFGYDDIDNMGIVSVKALYNHITASKE